MLALSFSYPYQDPNTVQYVYIKSSIHVHKKMYLVLQHCGQDTVSLTNLLQHEPFIFHKTAQVVKNFWSFQNQ